MDDKRKKKVFENFKKKAEPYLKDKGRLSALFTEANQKIGSIDFNRFSKAAFKEKFQVMVRMVRAYKSGDYKIAPWKSILMITAAILYFVMPLDMVPDFIPITGFLDDFTIFIWVYNSVKDDIHNFEEWEAEQVKEI